MAKYEAAILWLEVRTRRSRRCLRSGAARGTRLLSPRLCDKIDDIHQQLPAAAMAVHSPVQNYHSCGAFPCTWQGYLRPLGMVWPRTGRYGRG